MQKLSCKGTLYERRDHNLIFSAVNTDITYDIFSVNPNVKLINIFRKCHQFGQEFCFSPCAFPY